MFLESIMESFTTLMNKLLKSHTKKLKKNMMMTGEQTDDEN